MKTSKGGEENSKMKMQHKESLKNYLAKVKYNMDKQVLRLQEI